METPSARLERLFGRLERLSKRSRPRLGSPSASNRAGFALVAVIWSLGLITLLGTAVIVGSRYRSKVAASSASETAAAGAAESAINLGIVMALTASHDQDARFPVRCRMPDGAQVAVTLEQEAGKVDLNTGRPEIIARLFAALTGDPLIGSRIAGQIIAFRESTGEPAKNIDTPVSANKLDLTVRTGFTTITQLDEIDGVSPRLFRSALRFVTVRSGRPYDPLGEAASPALQGRQALNLDQKSVAPARDPTVIGSLTLRADVRAIGGGRFIREALISFAENGRPFVIREWRHGDIDPRSPSRAAQDDSISENSCFLLGQPSGS